MIHLQSVILARIPSAEADQFPFTVPVIRALHILNFTIPVTFMCGFIQENAIVTTNPNLII
jgi:predicted ATPase